MSTKACPCFKPNILLDCSLALFLGNFFRYSDEDFIYTEHEENNDVQNSSENNSDIDENTNELDENNSTSDNATSDNATIEEEKVGDFYKKTSENKVIAITTNNGSNMVSDCKKLVKHYNPTFIQNERYKKFTCLNSANCDF
ncbi:hypothetical protein RhiirB3_393088 [Rhizophagus irregularis]|nr:hypothetical protein RhiirB3_393088 [Rhizophagus irregularis]